MKLLITIMDQQPTKTTTCFLLLNNLIYVLLVLGIRFNLGVRPTNLFKF